MASAGAIQIAATSFSHAGGREYNEDALGECEAVGALRLFVLADGVGGHRGGDIASRIAVRAAQDAFRELPEFSTDTLRRCIVRADQAVAERQKAEPNLAQMASTIALVLVSYQRSQALLGNLGDSRCYVFRGNQVVAQSRDHSLVQNFIDAGLYPAGRLREHPKRNILYASLGANDERALPYLSSEPVALEPDDGLLLCSDGVWELLEDDRLAELHAASEDVHAWADGLVAAVRAAMPPDHDNFSAFALRCLPAVSSDDDTLPPGMKAAWVPEA